MCKKRCKWLNERNNVYVAYHDNEWGVPKYDDNELFELLILEMFQAGLSWEIVLNKRDGFRNAFDQFNIDIICRYDEEKIKELLECDEIIKNKLKITATINNAKIFKRIQKEYGSFSKYIWSFTNNSVIYEIDKTYSSLSDKITKDLKQKGMKFVGTIIIYSYLQAIGVIYSHDSECFLYKIVS